MLFPSNSWLFGMTRLDVDLDENRLIQRTHLRLASSTVLLLSVLTKNNKYNNVYLMLYNNNKTIINTYIFRNNIQKAIGFISKFRLQSDKQHSFSRLFIK